MTAHHRRVARIVRSQARAHYIEMTLEERDQLHSLSDDIGVDAEILLRAVVVLSRATAAVEQGRTLDSLGLTVPDFGPPLRGDAAA